MYVFSMSMSGDGGRKKGRMPMTSRPNSNSKSSPKTKAQPEKCSRGKPGVLPPPIPPNDLEEDDDELSDMCQVILSFQCKHCTFLSHDKKSLRTHFTEFHQPNPKAKATAQEKDVNVSQDLGFHSLPHVQLCNAAYIMHSALRFRYAF